VNASVSCGPGGGKERRSTAWHPIPPVAALCRLARPFPKGETRDSSVYEISATGCDLENGPVDEFYNTVIGDFHMNKQALRWTACGVSVLMAMASSSILTQASAADRESLALLPVHFSGLLNDYTPSAAVTKGGPYEMRGEWSLDVDNRHGTATFSAAMNMVTSDYGIVQNTVDKDDPTTRGAHTHHIVMEGTVSDDWATSCPTFSPPVSGGFVVSGPAYITGNGGPPPFGNSSQLTLCVLGAGNVAFSNITLTLGLPANKHFGTQPIHGVVLSCVGPLDRESRDCTVQQ
jgi:hypothetical protein